MHPLRPTWGPLPWEASTPGPLSSTPMWDTTCGPLKPPDYCLGKTQIL